MWGPHQLDSWRCVLGHVGVLVSCLPSVIVLGDSTVNSTNEVPQADSHMGGEQHTSKSAWLFLWEPEGC